MSLVWAGRLLGGAIPGTSDDFGQNAGYGQLLPLTYLAFGGGGSTVTRFNDFRNVFSQNPCPSGG